MCFRAKFSRLNLALLLNSGILVCVAPLLLMQTGSNPILIILCVAPFLFWCLFLSFHLPQYYELRDGELLLFKGWRKVSIPYASLIELQPYSGERGLFSRDMMQLITRDSRRFLISPKLEELFIREIAKRCPLLQRKGAGLGITFSPAATD